MTQEEKAKRYDEAVINGSRLWECGEITRENYEYIFPELRESEEDRIKHEIKVVLANTDLSQFALEYTFADMLAWLEKQGEQPQGKSALEAAKEVKIDNQNCVKPADKVEPKFKDGDYIVYRDYVWKVFNISLEKYYELLKINNEVSTRSIEEVDNNARLWDIAKDAKDGDVLTSDYEGGICITILKSVVSGNEIEMYCHSVNSELFIAQSGFSNATWHPATKEQRDILIKAMADAGYTFDFEKKELKKIEQKPAWSKEDEMFVHGLIRGLAAKRDIHGHTTFSSDCIDITETISWLKSLKDRVQPQPSKEWGEKDKGMLLEVKCLVDTLRSDGNPDYSVEELQEMWDWLDTIWQKVEYPQPKREWSEEDEKHLNGIINYIAFSDHPDDFEVWIDWLKSIKPKNRWKPSDEQMEMVDKIINALSKMQLFGGRNALIDLKHDLEKLREE